jgi:diguanylate cyclase (GGDEF)-like protein
MNNIFVYLNTALGASFIIILIFLDYFRKYNTDVFQRRIFLSVLGAAFFATAADFLNRILAGLPGTASRLYLTVSVFYIFQNTAYYLAIVFIDYFAYTNLVRAKKCIRIIIIFLSLYCISVLFNLNYHFYFYIAADNTYTPGPYYFIRLALSYLPILICFIDMLLASKTIQGQQLYLVIFFGLLTGAGAALDVIMKTSSLTWPCFAAALLYLYFFIIRGDSKIDGLTGLGNRHSFNEFIDKLARQSGKKPLSPKKSNAADKVTGGGRRSYGTQESWAIVMIDMDHFKEINDTLGHAEGDNALRDMAAIIKGSVRHSDFAARYGGDEFILATRAENDIQRLMGRIKDALAAQNAKKTRPYTLEISYGCDVFTTGGTQSIADFLIHIDNLMYRHKAERRRASDASDQGR